MRNIALLPLICGILLFGNSQSLAQSPKIISDSGIAATHYLPDFSYAGYDFGESDIPSVTNVINVADHGAIADDGKDDSAALLAALKAAHDMDGPVRVQMNVGRYILSEILWIEKSGIVLAGLGDGAGGTELYMPRPLNQMDDKGTLDELREYLVEGNKRERQPENNLDVLFSEYSWSAGFIWTRVPGVRHATYLERFDTPITEVTDILTGKLGSKSITVANPSALKVGDVLQIHWHNRAGPEGPLVKALYGEDRTDMTIGNRHWTLPDRPIVRQATRIEAINGNKVTIADPLMVDINKALPAYFAEWPHLTNVGLQDFAMTFPENPYFGHHNESGFNGVYFTGVHNGWINNITITNSDAGILTDDLANVTISNIVTQGAHKAHYSIHIGKVHNVLVDNVAIKNPTEHSFSFNTLSTKSVYKNSVGWVMPTLDQHSGANHQNLYDNLTLYIRPDGQTENGDPSYELFKAGGAPYWQPGHARYNTLWNVKILVQGGLAADQDITIIGASEGPDSRIVGMHGNRTINLDYRPVGYLEWMNKPVTGTPSLYDYQLNQRLGANGN